MFSTGLKTALFVIGLIGSILTICGFVPQTIKTFKSRDTSGLSLVFFCMSFISAIFWILTGVLTILVNAESGSIYDGVLAALPVLVTNTVIILLDLVILYIKFYNMSSAKKLGISEKQFCNRG